MLINIDKRIVHLIFKQGNIVRENNITFLFFDLKSLYMANS